MFNLLDKYLEKRFPSPSMKDIREERESQNIQNGRRIASRFTRGNVSIQSDDFPDNNDRGQPGAMHPRLKRMLKKQ